MDTNTNANLSENPRGMKTITKNTQDTNEDFIEIDINKRVENLKEENKAKDSLIFEKFKTNYDIAPLYVHEVFQQKNSLKNLPIGSKTDKSSKDLNSNTGASIFLVEKLEKQILETKQKKMEMKMMKKTFSNSEKKNFESFNKNTGKEGSEEVLFITFSILMLCFRIMSY